MDFNWWVHHIIHSYLLSVTKVFAHKLISLNFGTIVLLLTCCLFFSLFSNWTEVCYDENILTWIHVYNQLLYTLQYWILLLENLRCNGRVCHQNPSRYWACALEPIFHSPDIPIGPSVHESSPQLHSTRHHDVLGSTDSIEVNQFCILQFQKDFKQYEVCTITRFIGHGILRWEL